MRAKMNIGERVVILRSPTLEEDPDEAWLPEFDAFLNSHATILKDDCPYSPETMYAYVDVDNFADFYLPTAILTRLEN